MRSRITIDVAQAQDWPAEKFHFLNESNKKTVHEYNAVHAGSSFLRFSAKPFLKTEFKGSGLSRRALSFIKVCVCHFSASLSEASVHQGGRG